MGLFDKLFGGSNLTSEESVEVEAGTIYSPLSGKVVALGDVNDSVFSSGTMGDGIAIKPTNGEVVSPVNGKVVSLFPTGHAIGLESDYGEEVLIHIGIDTVDMNGEGFEAVVREGDMVKKGQLLIKFNSQTILNVGLEDTVMIIVTNSDAYSNLNQTQVEDIQTGERLMQTKKK